MICHHCKQPIDQNEAYIRIPPNLYDMAEYLHLTCYEARKAVPLASREDEWSI